LCRECGCVGYGDNSKDKRATQRFHVSNHPIIQSFEPGEDWYWWQVDQLEFELEP
jgi:hypothetical protein